MATWSKNNVSLWHDDCFNVFPHIKEFLRKILYNIGKARYMKKDPQVNVRFTEQEFKIVQLLKKKYSINISQFVKNAILEKYKKLEKDN